nr:unnamed protein product [Spirometra erinaceieuropaei]
MLSTAGHGPVDGPGRPRSRVTPQDWFDGNDAAISYVLAGKKRMPRVYITRHTDDNKSVFYRRRCLVRRRLWVMQDAWMARKAKEIQGYADRNEWKNFFSASKAVYGPPTKAAAHLLGADSSTLHTEKAQILQP